MLEQRMAVDRRSRFRDYMRRLDPTGDPAQAVASGFYVPPPNAVSQRIATRIELQPASNHLLLGGIGSGKTTELIAIERRLAAIDDLLPIRTDVPSRHRLEKLKPGVLVALAAIEATGELERERAHGLAIDAELEADVSRISTIAKGYYGPWYPEGDPDFWVPGVIEEPTLSDDVKALSDALARINSVLRRKLVVLFDGLDRVSDLQLLASVLGEDVPAISRAGVGVVIIGPQQIRFSPQRFIEKSFETVHLHGAVSIDSSEGQGFLATVLRARADDGVLPPPSAAEIARWSGGVLRDLVGLGRAAGAEEYSDGSDVIEPPHISTAAGHFGRDLLLGCTKEMAIRLKDLVHFATPRPAGYREPPRVKHREPPPAFTIATEIDQRLLIERLIIEIPGTPVRYIPHPTIVPLVAGLSGK